MQQRAPGQGLDQHAAPGHDPSMRWEHSTAADLRALLGRGCTLAILPVGSVEYHADHLATGIDTIVPHTIACRAAEIEEALVAPPVHYVFEECQKAHMGTIGIRAENLIPYLENVCDEIARNGFTKILIANGHGGNSPVLTALTHTILGHRKGYVVYLINNPYYYYERIIKEVQEGEVVGHACELETSIAMAIDERLVKREHFRPSREHHRDKRDLAPVESWSTLDWHINMPQGWAGDPTKASAAKGERLLEEGVARMVSLIRAIKADGVTAPFLKDNIERARKPWEKP
jgi:creatinine amidohydrolase